MEMLARPSVRHTTMTRPTSPDASCWIPVRAARDNPCASGEPPPQSRIVTPGGCQIGHWCDQNSTYGLHSLPGGVS
jgi:hypothetical protein